MSSEYADFEIPLLLRNYFSNFTNFCYPNHQHCYNINYDDVHILSMQSQR